MATPLVRIPQVQGGTMYAFANGTRDLTRALNLTFQSMLF